MAEGVRVKLTEAQKSAARSNMDSKLSFILCNEEVDEDNFALSTTVQTAANSRSSLATEPTTSSSWKKSSVSRADSRSVEWSMHGNSIQSRR